jgi:serine/threonine-protein kinase
MAEITPRLSNALAGRYQIERRLGQGGMATVYLAEDVKHDRRVALKVLKPELAAVLGAERFVQEIKTTASLQHPNILPLFDSGEADSFLYYVMPFIDGETLRQKLDRETQLGIDEAVRVATDVADALDYAHRNNVIHRDIKPENILLHDGRPMVADFGIALAVSAAAGGRMTETGLSLGTPHYMSPEQATAEKDLTNRSDIYSLGAVLYETLTGDPPHTGSSVQQIIMKIVTDEARPVTELRKSVPPNVAAATAKALEKLPADRFESAKAFATSLTDPGFTFSGAGVAAASVPSSRRPTGPTALLAVIATLTTIIAAWSLLRPQPVEPVRRYRMGLPPGQIIEGSWARLAVTRDGSRLIYDARTDGEEAIWVLDRASLEGIALEGTSETWAPFVSPDGSSVGYFRPGAIETVSLRGGTPTTVIDSGVGGGTVLWSDDGMIYYDSSGMGPIMRVPENGGTPERLSVVDTERGELDHVTPIVLPGAKSLLFTVLSTDGDRQVAVLELGSTGHRTLLERAAYPLYAEPGYLLYVSGEDLMAVRFDKSALEIVGDPVTIIEGVQWRTQNAIGMADARPMPDVALSEEGTLFYTIGTEADHVGEPVWVDRDGSFERIGSNTIDDAHEVALSPVGTHAAFTAGRTEANIVAQALPGSAQSRLTFGGGFAHNPLWTDDGESVFFVSDSDDGLGLYQRRVDGTREAELVADLSMSTTTVDLSSDGQWVLYSAGRGNNDDVFARRIGSDSVIVVAESNAPERQPALSPDGNWVTYHSTEAGSPEVFIRPFPNVSQGQWRVSSRGGSDPFWSPDGTELFYLNTRNEIVSIEIRPGVRPPMGQERTLFSAAEFLRLGKFIAAEPSGRRFLMIRPTERQFDHVELIVVENVLEVLDKALGR